MSQFTEKYNMHTHSFYCGHGSGTIRQYAEEAERQGLELLGFSEHCPFPDSFLQRSRMAFDQMRVYEEDVRRVQAESGVKIILGYECDYFPRYRSFFEDLKASGRVDYLITGTHFIIRADSSRVSPFSDKLDSDDILRYRDQMLAALDTGLFDFIAHPDLFMAGYWTWDDRAVRIAEEIIAASMKHRTPLEVNANGLQKPKVAGRDPYPFGPFFELAGEKGAPVILSTDAHKVSNLVCNKDRIEAFAAEHGLSLIRPVYKTGRLEWAL